jgi:Domain of unknown function (DUF4355)
MTVKVNESKFFLPLNLQHFADGGDGDGGADDLDDNGDDHTDDLDDNGTGGDPGKNDDPKFSQADIDRIVKERLDREKKKRDAALEKQREEAERKRLEEEQKYKELYEKLQGDLETQRKEALQVRKESLLAQAGYSEEQAKTLVKLVEGEDDEALKASLETVKTLFPPKKDKEYGDPNPGNGGRQIPKKKNLEDKGKSVYQRLKAKGKVRGK